MDQRVRAAALLPKDGKAVVEPYGVPTSGRSFELATKTYCFGEDSQDIVRNIVKMHLRGIRKENAKD